MSDTPPEVTVIKDPVVEQVTEYYPSGMKVVRDFDLEVTFEDSNGNKILPGDFKAKHDADVEAEREYYS